MINKINLLKLSDVKESFVYKIERGDTLTSIAEKFHTTITVIIATNNLKQDVEAGEFILVEKIFGREYFVKPKDTLDSIALEFGVNKSDIMIKNKTNFIYVGQKIYI